MAGKVDQKKLQALMSLEFAGTLNKAQARELAELKAVVESRERQAAEAFRAERATWRTEANVLIEAAKSDLAKLQRANAQSRTKTKSSGA